jgi:hypothetical protein
MIWHATASARTAYLCVCGPDCVRNVGARANRRECARKWVIRSLLLEPDT